MIMGVGPTPAIVAYWDTAIADPGKTKGPIHLVVKIIADCGAHGSPTQWRVPRHGVLAILRVGACFFVIWQCRLFRQSLAATAEAMKACTQALTMRPPCRFTVP